MYSLIDICQKHNVKPNFSLIQLYFPTFWKYAGNFCPFRSISWCKNLRRSFGTIRRLFGNVCLTSYINCVLCRPSWTGLPCAADIFIQICYQVPRELCSRGNPKQLEGFDFEVQVRKNCKETIRTKYHFTTIICEGSIANNITALMEFLVVYLW